MAIFLKYFLKTVGRESTGECNRNALRISAHSILSTPDSRSFAFPMVFSDLELGCRCVNDDYPYEGESALFLARMIDECRVAEVATWRVPQVCGRNGMQNYLGARQKTIDDSDSLTNSLRLSSYSDSMFKLEMIC